MNDDDKIMIFNDLSTITIEEFDEGDECPAELRGEEYENKRV